DLAHRARREVPGARRQLADARLRSAPARPALPAGLTSPVQPCRAACSVLPPGAAAHPVDLPGPRPYGRRHRRPGTPRPRVRAHSVFAASDWTSLTLVATYRESGV